ncbi:MAG: heavy metal-associated domain-containing protein [Thermoleophilia bacterium]|nr:heavy metal-associated domain-containing protein [Thermoleophilia bacterium]
MSEEVEVRETVRYEVPAMHCVSCARAIREEIGSVEGVDEVEVDLETKLVTVRGPSLDDRALRAAIAKAGYEAA